MNHTIKIFKNLFVGVVIFSLVNCGSAPKRGLVTSDFSVTKMSKSASKGLLIHTDADKEKNYVRAVYKTGVKKGNHLFEEYFYDYNNLSLVKTEQHSLSFQEARVKFPYSWQESKESSTTDGVKRFLQVENNLANTMVIKRGYYQTTTYYGNRTYSITKFVTENKEKYTDPKGRKLTLVDYRSDQYEYSANVMSGIWQMNKKGTEAVGDALIFSVVKEKGKGDDAPFTEFLSFVLNARNMKVKEEQVISFPHCHLPLSVHHTPDGGMAVVLAPMNRISVQSSAVILNKGAIDKLPIKEDLTEFVLLKIDKNGKEQFRTPFKVAEGNADIRVKGFEDGTFAAYGISAEAEKKSNRPNITAGFVGEIPETAESQIRSVTLGKNINEFFVATFGKDGKLESSQLTPLSEVLGSVETFVIKAKPSLPNASKWSGYFTKGLSIQNIYKAGNQYFVNAMKDKPSTYHMIQFNEKGKFVKSYFSPADADTKVSQEVFEGINGKAFWMIKESTKKTKENIWIKIGKFNINDQKVEGMSIPGNKQFFQDEDYSLIGSMNDPTKFFIYLSNGTKVYLGKVKLD